MKENNVAWDGKMSPLQKSAVVKGGFLDTQNHTENPSYEVTEVLDGFATVVVHFNHTCEYNGKTYTPGSNNIGYEYEYEVDAVDEVEAQRDLDIKLGDDYTVKDLLDLLETTYPTT